MTSINRIGKKYGRLLVVDKLPSVLEGSNKVSMWLCKCECGNEVTVKGGNLNSGNTNSCGCFRHDLTVSRMTKHGESVSAANTPEYKAWQSMKARCYNENTLAYKDYGGREIKVCDRWVNSFANFLEDMGRKPSKYHSLDRYPDTNGNYEPTNCRWGTDEQQCKNRRSNVWYEYNGKKMVMKDWAKELGVDNRLLHKWLKTKKRSFEETYNHFNKRKHGIV